MRHLRNSLRLPIALLLALLFVGMAHAGVARRKIVIDQDAYGPGGSNMQSMLMLLQAPDVEVLGITVTSGDGWRDEEVADALRLLEVAHRTDVPVYPGAVFPLVNSDARTRAWERRYGALVYKGAWQERPPSVNPLDRASHPAAPGLIPPSAAGSPSLPPRTESAAVFLARIVRQFPGEVTIWCGGPLTNVALASRLDPAFAGLAKELVFMGGSFNPAAAENAFADEYVNSPRREFNMRWDPEAASIVLHEPWRKITQVPVDPTTRTMFSKPLYAEIGHGRSPAVPYLVAFGKQLPMWDELTAAVWLDPTLATRSRQLLVDVETGDGAGYGNTSSWPLNAGPGLGERPVDVILDVDVPRFYQLVVHLLSGE